jgi:hypothetical protein
MRSPLRRVPVTVSAEQDELDYEKRQQRGGYGEGEGGNHATSPGIIGGTGRGQSRGFIFSMSVIWQ